MTAQGDRQASVRASTATALTYEGDWHALFDAAGLAPPDFDSRLLAWINLQLSASYGEIGGAMQAFAQSQGAANWSSLGAFSASGGYLPQTQALLAAMAVQPSAARAQLINAAIGTLISTGVWAKLDVLWMLASHDSQAGLLNWIAPSTYALTLNGTCTFATDRGYTGDGSTGYLSSVYAPGFNSALAAQDDNSIGVWALTAASGSMIDIGATAYSINPRNSATTILVRDSSATQNTNTVASGNSIGHTLANRTGSAGYDLYKNASDLLTATQVSSAPSSAGLYLLARNNAGAAGNFSTRQLAAAHAGKSLTAQNISDLYGALQTFLTALGN